MRFTSLQRPWRWIAAAFGLALALAIIALSLYGGRGMPPPSPGGVPQPEESTLNVLTYNMHVGIGMDNALDLKRVGDLLAASGADVIGLQEVDKHWAERSRFEDQAKWLADYLKFHYAFGANLDRAPLKPGEPRRQYGTAILSKYPIADAKNTLLPSNLKASERGEQRGILRATIDVGGTPVHYYSTHLGLNAEERRGQTAEIVKLIGAQGGNAILVGDLNAAPYSDEIKVLSAAFKDAFADRTNTYTFPADNPHVRADYIFYTPTLQLKKSEVIRSLASDHIPATAQFTFVKATRP